MPFTHRLTARFFDIDRAGIVFFATVYQYCHATFEELLGRMFGPDLDASFASGLWPMPLVHSEADYTHPIRLGDRLVVSLDVDRVGERSITFAYDMRGEDGVARARVRLVHAFVDPQSFAPRPVPRDFIERLRGAGLIAQGLP